MLGSRADAVISTRVRIIFVWIALFSVLANALILAVPLYMLQIYDRVLASKSLDTLLMISLLAAGALLTFGLLENVRGALAGKAAAEFDADNHPRVFAALIRGAAPVQGEPMRDIGTARNFLSGRPLMGLFDLPFTPIFTLLLFLVHPWIAWLTIAGLALLVMVAVANDWMVARRERAGAESGEMMRRKTQALVRDRETLAAMGMVPAGIAFWRADQLRHVSELETSTRTISAFFALSRLVRMGIQMAVLGLGGYLVLENQMTAGMIFASSLISARAIGPIEQAVGGWRSISSGFGALRRLRTLMSSASLEQERTALPSPNGQVSANKLMYHPRPGAGGEPILRGVSFDLGAGEILGIVGPSGTGKTTLARLLVGAMPPTAGTVVIDGTDLGNWPEEARFRHFGYLEQSCGLFPGTVAENISRLDPDRRGEDVVAAAQLVGAHEFIGQLPDGYETLVGPNGLRLSGGQTQRVALARAFYGDPRFVVLDEPNAFLDGSGEEALAVTLATARSRGITTVMITQRLSILKAVDRVLVLNNGTVEAIGPAEAMIARLSGSRPVPANGPPPPREATASQAPTYKFGWQSGG